MQPHDLIPAKEFCVHHDIEISFLHSLHENGLVEMITIEENYFLQAEEIGEAEKILRLYHDLHINLEGIDAICNLLSKMDNMQAEIDQLKKKLHVYEAFNTISLHE